MKARIFRSMLLLSVASALVCSAALCCVFYGQLTAAVRQDLRERALIMKDILADAPGAYAALRGADMRVTVVGPSGAVLFDDDEDVSAMSNHADRAEIAKALSEGVGESRRFSQTMRQETCYFAVRLQNGDVLRLAKTTSSIFDVVQRMLPVAALVVLAMILAGHFGAGRLTRRIVQPINQFDPAGAAAPYDELAPFARTIRKQRELIERQMQEARARADTMDAIMDSMREGIALIDPQGMVLSANRSALEVFGMPEGASGRSALELLRDVRIAEHVKAALSGQRTELTYEHAGGVYQVFFSPVAKRGAIVLFLDISERAGAERMRREFSANVSHELKTPLTSISAYAEMIVSGMAKGEDALSFVVKIKEEAARLIALVEDILMLSRLDEGAAPAAAEDVDLAQTAREAVSALSKAAQDAGVRLSVDASAAIVSGSRAMLFELVYNLADNGVKYNRPGGSVSVSVTSHGGQAILRVSDTGIGIPREHQARVFERFYRVDKSRSKKTGGTGLGLSIVKHIAAVHAGSLVLRSAEGRGTDVTVALPLRDA